MVRDLVWIRDLEGDQKCLKRETGINVMLGSVRKGKQWDWGSGSDWCNMQI